MIFSSNNSENAPSAVLLDSLATMLVLLPLEEQLFT